MSLTAASTDMCPPQHLTTLSVSLQLDAPFTPFRRARKAKEYILAAIKDRVAEKKREFERGSVKKDTLLSFFASAKVEEGDPLDEPELGVSYLLSALQGLKCGLSAARTGLEHSAFGGQRKMVV